MEKTFYNIFKTFFKVGCMLLGGGYVILPLLTSELAEKKKWLSVDELSEYYALSSSLPGIIAANTAIFTGRKLAGSKGALAAIAGVTLPAFIAIILFATVLSEIAHYKSVEYIFWGVGIGVITLLFLAVREMWSKCVVGKYTSGVFIFCLILALFTKISPAIIVICAIFAGIIKQLVLARKKGDKIDD
jgi:chromate transporter